MKRLLLLLLALSTKSYAVVCAAPLLLDEATGLCVSRFVDVAPDAAVMAEFWGYGFGLMMMIFCLGYFCGEIIRMLSHAK